MSEIVTVLCVEDKDDAETFDREFERDRASRCEFDGDEPRRLVRFGTVVKSDRAARAALLRAANDDVLPDIVLIDHMLTGDGREKYVERGLCLMAWIRDEFAQRDADPPACVLWTTRFNAGLAWAFVQCGGIQAIDRMKTWPDQLDEIWQAYDWHVRGEGRWAHAAKEGYPKLSLPPSCAALLPYLADDVPTPEIAAALGISQDVVHGRRQAFVEAINEQIPQRLLPGGKPVVVNGRSTSLAKLAAEHGNVWVPLAYADLVAGGSCD